MTTRKKVGCALAAERGQVLHLAQAVVCLVGQPIILSLRLLLFCRSIAQTKLGICGVGTRVRWAIVTNLAYPRTSMTAANLLLRSQAQSPYAISCPSWRNAFSKVQICLVDGVSSQRSLQTAERAQINAPALADDHYWYILACSGVEPEGHYVPGIVE
jgi:hypothetical protein